MLLLGLLIVSFPLEFWNVVLYSFVMQIHVMFMDVFVEVNILFISLLSLIHDCCLNWIIILNHSVVVGWLNIWTVEQMFYNSALALSIGLRDAVFTVYITNLVVILSKIETTFLTFLWCCILLWRQFDFLRLSLLFFLLFLVIKEWFQVMFQLSLFLLLGFFMLIGT